MLLFGNWTFAAQLPPFTWRFTILARPRGTSETWLKWLAVWSRKSWALHITLTFVAPNKCQVLTILWIIWILEYWWMLYFSRVFHSKFGNLSPSEHNLMPFLRSNSLKQCNQGSTYAGDHPYNEQNKSDFVKTLDMSGFFLFFGGSQANKLTHVDISMAHPINSAHLFLHLCHHGIFVLAGVILVGPHDACCLQDWIVMTTNIYLIKQQHSVIICQYINIYIYMYMFKVIYIYIYDMCIYIYVCVCGLCVVLICIYWNCFSRAWLQRDVGVKAWCTNRRKTLGTCDLQRMPLSNFASHHINPDARYQRRGMH